LIDAVGDLDLYWIECPIDEGLEHLSALRALRERANRRGIRLAGGEKMIRKAAFESYAAARVYDVMMPDVKYAGGIEEMLAISTLLAEHGIAFSPHNPTGPVCHVASVQVCAAASVIDALEVQFDETPLFNEILVQGQPLLVNGKAQLDPDAPGLGIVMNEAYFTAQS